MKSFFILILLMTLSACSSVTLRPDANQKTNTEPSFQKRYNYWWWGLKGKHEINVREVCSGKSVEQMQSMETISNTLVAILTLGIYSPRTARVWCKGEQS